MQRQDSVLCYIWFRLSVRNGLCSDDGKWENKNIVKEFRVFQENYLKLVGVWTIKVINWVEG